MKAAMWLAAGVGATGVCASGARAADQFVGEVFEAPVCVIVVTYYDDDGNPIDPFERPDVRTDDVRATALASALSRYGSLFADAPSALDGVAVPGAQGESPFAGAPLRGRATVPAPGGGAVVGAAALILARRRRSA